MTGLSHVGEVFHVLRFIEKQPVTDKMFCEMNRYS